MPVVIDNIDRLDDVDVLQRHAHAELCHDLALVVFEIFIVSSRPKLFDGVDRVARFTRRLDQTDSSTGTRAEHTTPFAVLFRQVRLLSFERSRLGEMTGANGRARGVGARRCTGGGNRYRSRSVGGSRDGRRR